MYVHIKLNYHENCILEGEALKEGQKLERRDGIGIWDTSKLNIQTSFGSKILLMEVTMN